MQITDSHVLVLPIEHFPNSLHLLASTFAEMERYLSALRSCFASQVLPTCQCHPMLGNKQLSGPVRLRSSRFRVPLLGITICIARVMSLCRRVQFQVLSSGFYELCRLCGYCKI